MGMLQFGLRLLVEREEGKENSSAAVTCKPNAKYEKPHASLDIIHRL